MPFFILDHSTPDKPEVHFVASALSISANEALGAIARTWVWADQQADGKGFVDGGCVAQVDSVGRLQGLGNALVTCKWLIETDGGILFPSWDRYFSASAKSRGKDACRKRASRKRGHNVQKSRTPNTGTDTGTDLKKEKSVALAPPFASDEFKAAWSDWLQYRTERKLKIAPTSTKQQYARLAKMTEPEAIAAIEFSIAQCYQGIYSEDKRAGTNHKPADQPGRPRKNADRYRLLDT